MKKFFHLLSLFVGLLFLCACGQTQPYSPPLEPEQTPDEPHIVSLVCTDGELTLRFHRGEDGAWLWTDNPSFPLDGVHVDNLLSQLLLLDTLPSLSDSQGPEAYELHNARKYATFVRSDGVCVTYRFGKEVEGASPAKYYVNSDQHPTRICLAPSTLLDQIGRGIYPMALLPQLPTLSAEQIRNIKLTQGDKTRQFSVYPGRWRSGGEDVTNQPQTKALEALLAQASLTACVDFAPSEGASELCGLQSPALIVRVSCADETTYTLTVGNLADGGEARYVTINDDTTIYLMGAALLQPLLDTNE